MELEVSLAGQTLSAHLHSSGESVEYEAEMVCPHVNQWSPESPALYFIETRLKTNGEIVDDAIDRVGFREIKTEDGKILLNGEPLFIKGFNRHEDHSHLGYSLSVQEMNIDLDLLLRLNTNIVRTSHTNPQRDKRERIRRGRYLFVRF